MKWLLIALLVLLAASCKDSEVPGVDEIDTDEATETTGTATDTVLFEANVNACRSNLRELAAAESMFFAANSTYCPVVELATSGFMDNACDLVCPACGTGYTAVSCGPDGYRIVCMFDAEAHGSIENGLASWD